MGVTAPYDPSLRPVLGPLADDLREALGDALVGLYLYGSAVSGGFDAGISDVDLVAVTAEAVPDLDLARLGDVHRRVVERDPSWQDRLEVVYVARATLLNLSGADPVAVISPGEPFHVTGPASDWLQNWYLVRETGVAVVGPPAEEVIAPLSLADYLEAVRAYLAYLRGAEPSGYAVLSACRALRTIETRAPCSKQQGASWARHRLPGWAWLIDAALEDRRRRGRSLFRAGRLRSAARAFVDAVAGSVG
jgi:hypothetical protein